MTESSRLAVRAVIGAGPLWSSFDEIALNGVDGRIVIQSPPGESYCVLPFIIGDMHNLYEWSMVLGDLHPVSPLGAVGTAEEGFGNLRMRTIELFNRPRVIFKALVAAYKSGKHKPVLAWYEEEADDKTLLRFRRQDVLKVISELGADGVVIRMLLGEREQQTGNDTAPVAVGSETASCEAAKATTHRKGGRKPRSGEIDDSADLLHMLHLLANGQSPSVWDAAGVLANRNDSTRRRLARKFSKQWVTEPPPGETWGDVKRDVERQLNTN